MFLIGRFHLLDRAQYAEGLETFENFVTRSMMAVCNSAALPCTFTLKGAVESQRWSARTGVKMVSKVNWGKAQSLNKPLKIVVKASTVDINAAPSVLVDKLLSMVADSDRGTQIGEPERRAIDEIVNKLETLCIPEPLSSPLLFGDWDVAYSSNPTAPGGYYRSMLGRAVLKTREMVQSINAPDAITNKVSFAAFGILDGKVTLQGKLTALDKKWVEVVFEPPQVELGAFKTQYGGNSNVKLAILYLDEVVRIGRGSRGSLFIFKRRDV